MKPWKDAIRPHRDVREGTFRPSDFAVNLMKVVNETAPAEYQDAQLFFERTFVTESIGRLLADVAARLSGTGGSPVVELKTNFGGGKSHTLLAVYHMAGSKGRARELPGVADVLDRAGVGGVPAARVAVIDGNYRSPSEPRRIDGRTIRTLWGDLAYRLLGGEGYDMVSQSDKDGKAPGKERLESLLSKAAPCVILLDELVAYYRQLDQPGLPGGSYDANLSFAQQLTESVENTPDAAMLVTLPQSEGEAGGAWGQKALHDLGHVVHRVAATWQPVTRDEGFEIVRRRLFEPIEDEAAARETCEAFKAFCHEKRDALPREAQEAGYLDAFSKCYPIHPEVFYRLYDDWSTLDGFQKTRGVLQLVALAVHRLWSDPECREPLIMPGSLPFGDAKVSAQATQWLPSNWGAILDDEIDGEGSAPVRLDKDNPQFGRLGAAKRVARTVFLGSAPSVAGQAVRGPNMAHVLLGCAQPGEELSFYKDALEKMADSFRYLFHDGDRYWYDTRPNLNRTVQEKAARVSAQAVEEKVREAFSAKWGAPQVPGVHHAHIFESGQTVPDDIVDGLRLVVLAPDSPYSPAAEKPAFDAARNILEYRGASPRAYRNRIAFLAADYGKWIRTAQTCRMLLAWEEVCEDIDAHRLDVSVNERGNARRQIQVWKDALEQTVGEAFCHLLVPVVGPKGPAGPCGFDRFDVRTAPVERLGDTVSRALVDNEAVVRNWAARFLRDHLDKTYFGGSEDVSVRKVWDDMARFLDYQRLASADVLRTAVENGVRDGLFGYASGKNPDGVYEGFKFKQAIMAGIGDRDFLIKASKAEQVGVPTPSPKGKCKACGNDPCTCSKPQPSPLPPPTPTPPPSPAEKRKFQGTVEVDISEKLEHLDEIRDDVLALLAGRRLRANVKLSIRAESGEPFPPDLLRALKTNARLLDESGLS